MNLEDSLVVRNARLVAAMLGAERDPERCRRDLVALAGPQLERADVTARARVALTLVRCAIAMGRLDEAAEWARSSRVPSLRARADVRARGDGPRREVLLARGEASQAAAVALGAVATAGRAGARRDEVVARLLAGRALAASGNAEIAKAELRQAAEDARRGGALALVGDAARELRRLGTRIPGANAPTAGAGELTGRERDVADLVIQGRSNKQVAADLFLSEKTVEGTLTRVYSKLGVRSRVELVRNLNAT